MRKVILFGSLATGQVGPASDIDLLVIQDTSTPFLQRPDLFERVFQPQVAVDFLIYTPREPEELLPRSALLCRALREGEVLSEA